MMIFKCIKFKSSIVFIEMFYKIWFQLIWSYCTKTSIIMNGSRILRFKQSTIHFIVYYGFHVSHTIYIYCILINVFSNIEKFTAVIHLEAIPLFLSKTSRRWFSMTSLISKYQFLTSIFNWCIYIYYSCICLSFCVEYDYLLWGDIPRV